MPKHVAPELVTETVRFCTQVLRRKADAIDSLSARSPAEALAAVGQCMLTESLLELAEPCQRVAEGLPLYPGSSASALDAFGEEAEALRAMLAELEAAAAE